MPGWLPRVLRRLHLLATERRLAFTHKAMAEMWALGLSRDDVLEIVAGLSAADRPTRTRAFGAREWMYEFRPEALGLSLYLKVVLREHGSVVSCHEDQPEEGSGGAY